MGRPGPEVTAACVDAGVRRVPDPGYVLGVDAPVYATVQSPPARQAPAGQAVVAAVRYGATEAIADRAALRAHLARAGVREEDVVTSRFLARMVVAGAAPTAARGGLGSRPGSRRHRAAGRLPGRRLGWADGPHRRRRPGQRASRRAPCGTGFPVPGHDGDVSQDPFEAARSRIRGLAYRMLGTLTDADDKSSQTPGCAGRQPAAHTSPTPRPGWSPPPPGCVSTGSAPQPGSGRLPRAVAARADRD